MRFRTLAAGMLFAVAGSYPAFAQALAEGALVHANSAAAGAKAGTALGNALSHATTQIGQQMHTVTTTHVAGTPQTVPHRTAAVSGGTSSSAASSSSNSSGLTITSSSGLTITSIKGGGHLSTNSSEQPSSKSGGQPSCAQAPANAGGNSAANLTPSQTQPCATSASTQTQSKSVVHSSVPQ
jgi:hypothetical protein